MLCKIGTLSATPGVRYATPKGVATPSLGSPGLNHYIVKSPQLELSDDALHMRIACVLIALLQFKIYVMHEWFWWLPIF